MTQKLRHQKYVQRKIEKKKKRWNDFKRNKNRLKKRGKKSENFKNTSANFFTTNNRFRTEYISFPTNCCFLDNYEEINKLINRIINLANNHNAFVKKVFLDLSKVNNLDSAAINILLTLTNYLNLKHITVYGNMPENIYAQIILINSGFFNLVKTKYRFETTEDHIFTLSGNNKTNQDAIASEIRQICMKLIGYESSYQPLYNTLGEIAGNSVEHANPDFKNKNWFMSVHYENDSAIIQIADIGKGILNTLNLLLKQEIFRILKNKNACDIIRDLFKGVYQSSTRELNRNNGLPEMLECYNKRYINNVIVITNKAVYDFSENRTTLLNNNFPGTFYSIEIRKENIIKWQNRLK